jgi:PKD repeat protein
MKKIFPLVVAGILLAPVQLLAQEKVTALPVSPQLASNLFTVFKKFALFQVNTAALAQYVQQAGGREPILFTLDLPGYASFAINMREHNILDSNYRYVAGSPQGSQVYTDPGCATYKGWLDNNNGGEVYLTIASDLLYGYLGGGSHTWFIEPLQYFNRRASGNIYVVYDAADVIPNTGMHCGVTETMLRHVPDGNAGKVEGSAAGTCRLVEMAIASDDSMYLRYASAARVQQHNIAVMNVVVGMYYSHAQFGSQYLEFKIAGQYVSTTAAGNPEVPLYTGYEAPILLNNFSTWAEAGNFGFTYDVGEYWTTRNIATVANGAPSFGVVGLAYVNSACTGFKYHLIEDYSGADIALLGCLVAHETGHNLGANHDADGTPYIMAPGLHVPPYTTFSSASIAAITSYISGSGGSCFSACNAIMPVAQFNASATGACTNTNVTFTNFSVGQVSTYTWRFQDGIPATSTDSVATVRFTTPGIKAVTLTATNATGTTSVTKNIFVSNANGNGCRTSVAGTSSYGYVVQFLLQDINHSNAIAYANSYNNYSCTYNTALHPGTTYAAAANIGFSSYATGTRLQVFIDYNNDGDFSDAGEAVYVTPSCLQGETAQFSFTTPAANTVTDTWLRLRLVATACNAVPSNGCSIPNNSMTEDYAVYFPGAGASLPVTLIGFDGYYSNGRSELNWQTQTEVNTDYFVIERSVDGGNSFTALGRVPATGAGQAGTNHYFFTDDLSTASGPDRYYYRLKMVDKNGAYQYSKLVIIQPPAGSTAATVWLYPNPVSRHSTLQIKKAVAGKLIVEVFNSMGQRVYTKQLTAAYYNTGIDIPAAWSAGIYTVRITDSRESWSGAVMVK